MNYAQILSENLCAHMQRYGPVGHDPNPPDQIILAKCLEIAPAARLLAMLKSLQRRGNACGSTYAWFVTVFARMLEGASKPPPRKSGDLEFGRSLLHHAASGSRRL